MLKSQFLKPQSMRKSQKWNLQARAHLHYNKIISPTIQPCIHCQQIKCSMLNLIESYFKNRSQSTVINNFLYEQEILNVGIIQGSCLGPLLFLVYINDIFLATNIKLRLFVDDACLSYQHCDFDQVNVVINKELSWIDEWLLRIDYLLIIQKLSFYFLNN